LIRHGLAGEHGTYANDDERPLTDEGHHKTRQVAQRLHELKIRFDVILTSPLVRAHQTAEILKKEGLSTQLEISPHLAPDGDLNSWLPWLQTWQAAGGQCLALVGHEPNLSTWAELLIWGHSQDKLILKKAGVIGLHLSDRNSPLGNSQLFWLAAPRLLL
jgi:phosphohistidine phosphatase